MIFTAKTAYYQCHHLSVVNSNCFRRVPQCYNFTNQQLENTEHLLLVFGFFSYRKILSVYNHVFQAAICIKSADVILNISGSGVAGQVERVQVPHPPGKVLFPQVGILCRAQCTLPSDALLEPKDTFGRHIWLAHKYFWIILFCFGEESHHFSFLLLPFNQCHTGQDFRCAGEISELLGIPRGRFFSISLALLKVSCNCYTGNWCGLSKKLNIYQKDPEVNWMPGNTAAGTLSWRKLQTIAATISASFRASDLLISKNFLSSTVFLLGLSLVRHLPSLSEFSESKKILLSPFLITNWHSPLLHQNEKPYSSTHYDCDIWYKILTGW